MWRGQKDTHTVNSMREEKVRGRGLGGGEGWMEDSRGPRAVFQEAPRGGRHS